MQSPISLVPYLLYDETPREHARKKRYGDDDETRTAVSVYHLIYPKEPATNGCLTSFVSLRCGLNARVGRSNPRASPSLTEGKLQYCGSLSLTHATLTVHADVSLRVPLYREEIRPRYQSWLLMR